MATLIALLAVLGGAGLVTTGLARWLRHRRRRLAMGMVASGAVALLAPDAIAAAVVAVGRPEVLTSIALVLWRLAVIAGVGLAGLLMVLTSDPVTRRLRLGRDRLVRSIPLAPWRIRAIGPARTLPRDWHDLVEVDRALGRRLLSYGGVDEAASHPTLRDHDDPVTATAVEAMLRCDTLRESARTARDARATPYAVAVAELRERLDAAEAHAERVAVSSLAVGEQAAIERASRRLAYLQAHSTSPAERQAAYERVVAELSSVDPHAGAPVDGHPWLDIDQRVGLR